MAVHSSRRVQPSVVSLSKIVEPRLSKGPGPLGAAAPWEEEGENNTASGDLCMSNMSRPPTHRK